MRDMISAYGFGAFKKGQRSTEKGTGMEYVVREIKAMDGECTVVLFRDMGNGHHSYVYATEKHYSNGFELTEE